MRLSINFMIFFRLLNSEIKDKALIETALLVRVATHKGIYFSSSWANILKELEKDYDLMKAMFFREIPDWKLILETIEKFEKEFNSYAYQGQPCL